MVEPRFANAFVGDWQTVAARVEKGRHIMSTLNRFVEERAELEVYYAQRLRTISSKLSVSSSETDGVGSVVAAVRNESERRADHAVVLADSLKADLLQQTLSATVRNHQTVLKHITSDAAALTASLESLKTELRAAEREMALLGRQSYQQARDAQRPEQWSCNAHTRMTARWISRERELSATQTRYRRLVRHYNEAAAHYRDQMKVILNSLEDMDTKRINCLKDVIMKMLVFEISEIRNIQYDTEQTVKIVETLDPAAEVAAFVEKNRLRAAPPKTHRDVSEVKELHWAEVFLLPECAPDGRQQTTSSSADEDFTKSLLRPGGLSAVVQNAAAHLGITPLEILPNPAARAAAPVQSVPVYSGPAVTAEALQWLSAAPSADANSRSQQALQRLQNEYAENLQLVWSFTPEISRQVAAMVNRLKNELSAFLPRNLFLRALVDLDEKGCNELPSMEALCVLAQLLECCLIAASDQSDSCNLRTLLVLVQRFYARGGSKDDPSKMSQKWLWPHMRKETPRDVPLATPEPAASSSSSFESEAVLWPVHRALYHLPLWGHVRTWEEELLYAIGMEQQVTLLQETERRVGKALENKDSAITQTPRIFKDFVTRFAEIMVAFGITADAAMALIRRVLERNNLLPQFAHCLDVQILDDAPTYLPLAPLPLLAYPPPQPAEAAPIQTLDGGRYRSGEKSGDKLGDKSGDKAGDMPKDKPEDKLGDNFEDKSGDKSGDKFEDKSGDKSEDRNKSQDSSNDVSLHESESGD